MAEIENELLEIENYIKTLEINDNDVKNFNNHIKDGMEKGLIYNFGISKYDCAGTMYSDKVIEKEQYLNFKNYIERCEQKTYDDYNKWINNIIESNPEYSKDELKYSRLNVYKNKLI
jgi:hypothetical protein